MGQKPTGWQITKAWLLGPITLLLVPTFSIAGMVYGNTKIEGGKVSPKHGQTTAKKKYPNETVFLLHGLMRNNQDMSLMQNELVKRGYLTVNWSYPSDRFDIEQLGDQLAKLVHEYPNKKIHFVGHSMGGIVTRAYMAKYHPDNVGRVITIGTPNAGASIASLFGDTQMYKSFFGPAGTNLRPDNIDKFTLAKPSDFPKTEFATVIGATGNDAGMNPFIKGDNDGLVGVKEALLQGSKASLTLPYHHMTIHLQKDTIEAVANFIELGQLATKIPTVSDTKTQ